MKKQLLALSLLAAAVSLKAQRINPYPVIPLDSVQYVSPSKLAANSSNDLPDYINPSNKYPFGDTVNIDGIVVTNPRIYGLATNTNTPSTSRVSTWLQKKGGGPWSGVQVMLDPTQVRPTAAKSVLLPETKFYDNCLPGYPVRMTVRHGAFDKETQLYIVRNSSFSDNSVEQLSFDQDTLVYTTITIDSLMNGNPTAGNWIQNKIEGEKWEGVLVEIKNVVVNTRSVFNSTRWNWSIQDANGNQLDIRDVFGYYRNDDNEDTLPKITNQFSPPQIGTVLSSLKGVITEYQIGGVYRYGIAPIYPGDVTPCTVCPPTIGNVKREPVVVTQNDAIKITASVLTDATIASARVYYARNKSYDFSLVNMTKNADDTWSGNIPAQPGDTVIRYYIQATDSRNLTSLIQEERSFLVVRDALTRISTLQFSNNAALGTIWSGDSLVGIDVKAVVTGVRLPNFTTIQQGQGPNSAIYIRNSATTDTWNIGDSVRITAGAIREDFNVTTLFNVTGQVLAKGVALPEPEMNLPIDSFRLNRVAYSRPWEGVLMKFENVYVSSVNADSSAGSNFGEWSFNKGATDTLGLRADDAGPGLLNINRSLIQGQSLESVTGVMYFSFSNFKLLPRNLSDMSLCALDTVKPTFVNSGFDTVSVGSGPYAGKVTANDGRDGNLTGYITSNGNVNTAAVGDYTITFYVSDFCGNMDSTIVLVNVKDTAQTGLNNNELASANISVYPSPAKDVITISAKGIKTLPLNVAVYDVIGREMLSRSYNETNVSESINISSLNNGVYFCVIKNEQGSRTIKFLVSGK